MPSKQELWAICLQSRICGQWVLKPADFVKMYSKEQIWGQYENMYV